MPDKKVLVVTYYWPPSGGAAVQRWLSFSNKLVEAGWEVHILTVDDRYATYQLVDESLRKQIDPRIAVHVTKTFEPFGIYKSLFGRNSIPKPAFSNETKPSFPKKIARFIRGNFFIPDPRKGWKKFAVPKALEIIGEHGIKNIITAGPPHSTHFIGKEAKKTFAVRWIADFHDLWTDVIYYDMLYHLPAVKKKDLALERDILESADYVLTVGEKYQEKLLSKSVNLNRNKFKVIRIGYDETAFEKTGNEIEQKEFIITYTGSIADFYHPDVLFEALKKVLSKYPSVPFKLQFVGVLSEGIKTKIFEAGLGNILDEKGYVPHEDSIRFLREASILLLVNPRTKDEEMVIPGKLYEYLAAQKPIINITTLSAETALIVKECNAGKTFERKDQQELENYLSYLLEKWIVEKEFFITGSQDMVKQYSRQAITVQLISLLD